MSEEFIFDINEKDAFGKSALYKAVEQNNLSQIEQLISVGADVNSKEFSNINSPLHEAANRNVGNSHYRIAELLLKNGANANALNMCGQPPLYYLLKNCSAEILHLFFSYNADINMVDKTGSNFLFLVLTFNKNVEVVQLLINLGLNYNQRNNKGNTPLHMAAMLNVDESMFKIIEILLKSRADVNARNNDGETPFHFLIKDCNIRMVQLFLFYKADLNVVDNVGKNLLFSAIIGNNNKNIEVLQLLIDLGFSVNQRDVNRFTPLHHACEQDFDNSKIINCLLKNGAVFTAVDRTGHTCLHKAVSRLSYSRLGKRVCKDVWNSIVKHIDFMAMCNDTHILKVILLGSNDFVWKTVLETLAKLRADNNPVQLDSFDNLAVPQKCNNYYKQCENELLRAKSTKVMNSWLTYYNFLEDDRKKLKNYAGNEDLIAVFKKNLYKKEFPIYGSRMDENFKKGLRRRKLFDKSSIMLSFCFPIFNPNHLVIRDVLDCIIGKKDLSKFCE